MKRIYKTGFKTKTPKNHTLEIIDEDDEFVYLLCSGCHQDSLLFPEPFKVKRESAKDLRCKCPCACSGKYRWSKEQREVQIKRLCESIGYIFHGFAEDFKGNLTKISLENTATGFSWKSCNIANFINCGKRDPSIPRDKTISLEDRISQVEKVLEEEGNHQTIDRSTIKLSSVKMSYTAFTWFCEEGHSCRSKFSTFLSQGRRCNTCRLLKMKKLDKFTSYYEDSKNEDDYLYIMKLEERLLKIGRSFHPERRRKEIKSASGLDVEILYLEKSDHKSIFQREEELLLKTEGFQFEPETDKRFQGWTECRVCTLEDILN